MENVISRLSDGVGELVLNRPKQRNALTGPLVVELTESLTKLLADPECKVIVLRGAEGFFCAGLDLKAFSATPAPEWRSEFQSLWANYHQAVYLSNIPIIGALEGFAIAGGSSLALSCDFLIAGESAFMHVSEVERNMLAPLNVFWLTQRYGYQIALRLGLLGERWSATDLQHAGIVERVVADDDVVGAAMDMANRFASFDTANVRALKRSIKAGVAAEENSTSFHTILDHIKNSKTD